MTTSWLLLFTAGLLEVIFALSLKWNGGFTKLGMTVLTGASAASSFFCLSQAIKGVPIGIAYAVWAGMGIAGIEIVGLTFLSEPFNLSRVFFIGLIIAGIVGLRLS